MPAPCRPIDTCRVCGESAWHLIHSFGEVPLANGFLDPAEPFDHEDLYPLDVQVCQNCWLMCLGQAIEPAAMFRDYVYVTSDSATMTSHMASIVEMCAERAELAEDDLVVEFGSNTGQQMQAFQRNGQLVIGVDPAQNLTEIAHRKGLDVRPDFFGRGSGADIAAADGPAQLVLGRQCFAHIEDVHNVLDGVTEVLSDRGVLAIEVPYLVDLLEDNQFDTIYHEHASYYSVATLTELFRRHDLVLFDAVRVGVHGGSIVVFAGRRAAGYVPGLGALELLNLEARLGLNTVEPYDAFAARIDHVTDEVQTLVRDLVTDGYTVACYGAPSKGCALLDVCGLGVEELAFASDTTQAKHGLLLPGSHIPVVSPEEGRLRQPDAYVLLAWNYAEEILRKEADFLAEGGSFIIPIPTPRVVLGDNARIATTQARSAVPAAA